VYLGLVDFGGEPSVGVGYEEVRSTPSYPRFPLGYQATLPEVCGKETLAISVFHVRDRPTVL
jgi:hypothetical protein